MSNRNVQMSIDEFSMLQISFNPNKNEGPVIVLVGRRDTGKSYLVRDLMYFHRDIPMGTVISGTEAGNGFYKPMVPKILTHNTFDSALVEGALRRQKDVLKQVKRDVDQYGRSSVDPRAFIILDDCLYDDKWTRDVLIRLVFMNGRHWKLMMLITMQYPMGIPPVLRTNIDFVFILREPIRANRERIWKNYASMFPTLDTFCTVMDNTTENYECLVINNNAKSNHIRDMVFWYKASNRPSYRLTSKEYWDMSESLPDDDENDTTEFSADMHAQKRGGGAKFNVNKCATGHR